MTNQSTDLGYPKEPCLKEGESKIWKFVHQDDFSYKTDRFKNPKKRACEYNWLKITEDGTIIVKGTFDRGYAWDGCTPKVGFIDNTFGILDGRIHHFKKADYKPKAYYASMVHDVLYQYKRCAPITRKEADKIFLDLLKEADYMWALPYYWAVRSFGWIFSGWKYNRRTIKNWKPEDSNEIVR